MSYHDRPAAAVAAAAAAAAAIATEDEGLPGGTGKEEGGSRVGGAARGGGAGGELSITTIYALIGPAFAEWRVFFGIRLWRDNHGFTAHSTSITVITISP